MARRLASGQVAASDFERRYLTIGFVDLVGATSLSERLDPEELTEIYARVRQVCFEAVSQMHGSVVAPAGDGVMFEFGYPRARENDAERALAAALAVIQRLNDLDLGGRFGDSGRVQARIGVCSGLVLVGYEKGASWTFANNIVGEATNVAHRLQSLAEPNQIIVSQETIEAVEGLFDVKLLGPLRLAGLKRRVTAFQLLSRSYKGRRGPIGLGRRVAPLVGRNRHLHDLRQVWEAAQIDRTLRVVELLGDAGIGKSRLLDEFTLRFIPDDKVIRLHCFDTLSNTPFHAFTNLILTRAGALQDEANLSRLKRVSEYLVEISPKSRHDYQIVASAIGLPLDAAGGMTLTPRQRKKGEFALHADFLVALCSGGPSLIILEDVHWLDPSSRELLPQIFERLANEPCVVLMSSRHGMFGDLPHVSSLVLEPLNREESLQVADFISHEYDLSRETLREVVDASDGIPFFIEQLVISRANTPSPAGAASASRTEGMRDALTLRLAKLLFDRLDRFPAGKKLMRVISAFGQPTSLETIASVLEITSAKLVKSLDLLVEERILSCTASLPSRPGSASPALMIEYDFRHALLQRACYESMVSATREDLHRRICRVMGAQIASGALVPMSVFAHHLFSAGLFEEAAHAWLKGGVASARRSANAEAIDHLTKARAAAARTADADRAVAVKLKVLAALIAPLVAVRGFSAPEVLECCAAGLDLCQPTDDTYVFPFMYARFTSEISSGQIRNALASAETFESLSRTLGYEPGEVISGRLRAMALFTLGRPAEAEAVLGTSIATYQPLRDESIAFLYGANSKVTGQSLLSLVLFYRGKTAEAAELGSRTLQEADEIRHPLSTGIALAYIGAFIPAYCSLAAIVEAKAERMFAFSAEHKLRIFTEYGRFFMAWSAYQLRRDGSTIDTMSIAVRQLESFSWRLTLPSILALLGEIYVETGRFAEAQSICERAHTLIRTGGERWGLSEVLRVQALAAAGQKADLRSIEVLIKRALRAARLNESPLFEARAVGTALALVRGPEARLNRLRQRNDSLAACRPDTAKVAALLAQ